MSKHEFDRSGIPIADDCPVRHPVTGNGCLEVAGHRGNHRAMGTERIQMFGPNLVESEGTS